MADDAARQEAAERAYPLGAFGDDETLHYRAAFVQGWDARAAQPVVARDALAGLTVLYRKPDPAHEPVRACWCGKPDLPDVDHSPVWPCIPKETRAQ